ncbi:MAG: cell surface protein SprA, partial [Muribaculaceae bacterium]|nr:cell surface protein SprA [Muribaculaceae bacterium]
PLPKAFKPFSFIKSNNKNLKFFKEWELQYLPNTFSFQTNMSRYYYEQQTRSEADNFFQLPVSVSKNFLWDRQLSITWNLTKSLNFSFNSNTSARIEETVGAVNRKLFPDEYREWRDTVMSSILSLGTPWSYNQTFTATYRAPFSRIPVLDFMSGNLNYNSTYRWDRGATIDGLSVGNSIANQASWTGDIRLNLESLYKKIPYLKDVDKRFASRQSNTRQKQPRHYERTLALLPDTNLVIRHNMRTTKLKVTAKDLDGKKVPVKFKAIDANKIEILDRGTQQLQFTIDEVLKDSKPIWREVADYSTRFAMMVRSASFRYKSTSTLSLPLFRPDIGDIFGQSTKYGPMSPGLDFAFGFAGDDYITRAKERGWLITDDGQTSPAIASNTRELNLEVNLEPIKGLKIQLTTNHTDNHTTQTQFMYADMPVTHTGSFTMTHWALATALKSSSADNGYDSKAFNNFLAYIPVINNRVNAQYASLTYPSGGFMEGNPNAGQPYNPSVGQSPATSSDVLIPAFIAAYSGRSPESVYLTPFPSFRFALPNWRVTYDGLINYFNLRDKVKSISLTHAYQCTYAVGNYSSYLNWLSADGSMLGFTLDELTGNPIPSSPYNISSVTITERFAPLIGVSVTLKNDLKFNCEYRDQRTLTLNTSAGQLVESTTKGLTIGCGYKIVGFNTVLKMKGSGRGVSNDLTLNAEFSLQNNQALIRRIESAYTQPTSGTRTLNIGFTANYILSRRLTLGAFFDHRVNTPLV